MLEIDHQILLAHYLDSNGYLWAHPPNEGKRKPQYTRKLTLAGLKKGLPDCLIFSGPNGAPLECRGIAIELKRDKKSKATPEQAEWLEALTAHGWLTAVAHGYVDAVEKIKALASATVTR